MRDPALPGRDPAHASRLRPVKRVSAPVREQVLQMLRAAILQGEWGPGTRLIERDLCERTGASRASVREVLRQLESEGLVEVVPNRGPRVATISPSEVTDIYELRQVLEGLAAGRFAERASADAMAELRTVVVEIRTALTGGDPAEALHAKDRFYDVLLAGAGNSVVTATLKQLQNRIRFLRGLSMAHPGRRDGTIDEIEAILEAVMARDPAAATKLAEHHVRKAAETVTLAIADRSAVRDLDALIAE